MKIESDFLQGSGTPPPPPSAGLNLVEPEPEPELEPAPERDDSDREGACHVKVYIPPAYPYAAEYRPKDSAHGWTPQSLVTVHNDSGEEGFITGKCDTHTKENRFFQILHPSSCYRPDADKTRQDKTRQDRLT